MKRIKALLFMLLFGVLAATASAMSAAPPLQEGAEEGQAYIVQADDWLSKIAERYLGDMFAYPAIVEATNAKAAEDDTFSLIDNPDVIEIGQKLWIPVVVEAEAVPPTATATAESLAEPGVQTPPAEIATDVLYPEGPLYIDGTVYFVEYADHTIMAWDGASLTELWRQDGCGPAAIVQLDSGNLVVSCYDANTLVEVDLQGTTVNTIDADSNGQGLLGPNDFTKDAKGGLYFSASGVFDTAAPVEGKIYYWGPDGIIKPVADGIHYSNGLAITDNGQTLLASEHLAAQVLKFSIAEDGSLSNREVWRQLSEIVPNPPGADDYTGPDGLKVDAAGNVYICQYGGGRVIVASPEGTLLRTLDVPAPYVTNVNFGPNQDVVYVTAAIDAWNPPYPGAVYEVPNF